MLQVSKIPFFSVQKVPLSYMSSFKPPESGNSTEGHKLAIILIPSAAQFNDVILTLFKDQSTWAVSVFEMMFRLMMCWICEHLD